LDLQKTHTLGQMRLVEKISIVIKEDCNHFSRCDEYELAGPYDGSFDRQVNVSRKLLTCRVDADAELKREIVGSCEKGLCDLVCVVDVRNYPVVLVGDIPDNHAV